MSKEMIDRMVDRFLCWQLPADFAPDCGISFDGRQDEELNKSKTWPVGTNLLTAEQAKQMFSHCLDSESRREIGSPLGGGFFAGEIVVNGERFALIVASKAEGEAEELEYKQKARDVFDGTTSDDDGLINSNLINDANHPAAQFCRGLQIGGFDDWYLPSRDELMMLWRNLGPRRSNTPELFREGGTEAFEANWYWSSTEHAQYSGYAWTVNFGYGNQSSFSKNCYLGVRAVRRLKI